MLKTTKFQAFGQKVAGVDNKVILCIVLPTDSLNENLPDLFTFEGFLMPQTIYTGTYPQIKMNMDSVVARNDLSGVGIAGIITNEGVFAVEAETKPDLLGISIK